MSSELNVLVVGDGAAGLLVDGGESVIVITESEQGPVGPPGPIGPVGESGALGSDLHFTYQQQMAASTWQIAHNLGKFPSITVVDSAGTEVTGTYWQIDSNHVTLVFTAPFTGTAYLN